MRESKPSRYGDEATIRRRLNREAESCTVSYRSSSDWHATIVGYGQNFKDALRDADAQLPPGEWLRTCVSTPTTIYVDLIGRDARDTHTIAVNDTVRAFPQYEGQTVIV